MANIKLEIAFWEYDRTRALANGTVKIDGVDATYHSAPIVTEIFRGMIGERRFDVDSRTFCAPFKMGSHHSWRFLFSRIAPSGTPPSS